MMRKCSQFGQKLGRVHCQVVAITKPDIAMGEKLMTAVALYLLTTIRKKGPLKKQTKYISYI
jgi:hypothetical protein